MKSYYKCAVVGSTVQGTSGADQVVIQGKVIEGPAAGTVKYWKGSLHENSWEITARALRAMGWRGDDFYELKDGPINGLGDFLTQWVEVDREYNGGFRRDISFINPVKPAKLQAKIPPKGVAQPNRFKAALKDIKLEDGIPAPKPEELENLQPTEEPSFGTAPSNGLPF